MPYDTATIRVAPTSWGTLSDALSATAAQYDTTGDTFKCSKAYFKELFAEMYASLIEPEVGDSLLITKIDWRNRIGEFWPADAARSLTEAQNCRAIICAVFKETRSNKWCARVCPVEGPMQGTYVMVYDNEIEDIRKKEGEAR
jgi:hypothetical protein